MISELRNIDINAETEEVKREVYDLKSNKSLHRYRMVYRVLAILFCLCLVSTVSYTH